MRAHLHHITCFLLKKKKKKNRTVHLASFEPPSIHSVCHAKSICLNFGIAVDYQGKCNLRFDDTNPEKENIDFVNSIQKDVNWLGFQWDGAVRYSSDYFDALYGYAVELINKGLAYVCFLNAEEMRQYRGNLTQPGKNRP